MERSMHDNTSRKEAVTTNGLQCEHWPADSANLPLWNGAASPPSNLRPFGEQAQWLARTIEAEIIPRLMLAHQSARLSLADSPVTGAAPCEDNVIELAQLVIGRDAHGSLDYVRAMQFSGVALEVIYLDLLAPTARRLGALWDADLCSFADVTIGLWRLQQVMHELAQTNDVEVESRVPGRRAMLVPVPGSQHTMGLLMVSSFFRRAGWEVWGDAAVSVDDILVAARSEWFDMVGLSIGSVTMIDQLASVILDVRKASRNKNLAVMVGGPIISADPSLVATVGADGMAGDAAQAVEQAESLVAGRAANA